VAAGGAPIVLRIQRLFERPDRDRMSTLTKTLILIVVLALGGGTVFLATWEIPAPSKMVERVIDDDRFPR